MRLFYSRGIILWLARLALMRPKRVMDAIVPLIMYWVIGDLGYIYSPSISHAWGKCMTCIYILYASTFLLAPACQALQQQRATVERMTCIYMYILYASTFHLASACQALQQQRATVERMTCIYMYILYASTFHLALACQALQQQRATVEGMSLAPPAHIEIVDCYAHRGEVDDIHYTMPWAMGESGTVPLVIVSSVPLLSLGPG